LASGLLENSADMPSISMGFVGKKTECRKPSVSALVKSQDDDDSDSYAPDSSVEEFPCEQSRAPLGWTVSFARISACKLRPLRQKNRANSNLLLTCASGLDESNCENLDGSCLETTAGETTASDHSDGVDDATDVASSLHCDDKASTSEDNASKVSPTAIKRQLIVRDIIVTLREETLEAQQAAKEAEKRHQESQKNLIFLEESQVAQQKLIERQRSLSQRKRRNQASHNQGIRAKAEKVLLEANSIKEQAENEAAEIRAFAVADAQQREDVELQQSSENAANLKAEIEVQLQAKLAQAEMSAHEIKQQASVEAALKSEALVELAKCRAQEEADAIKAGALKHALALRAKVEEQVHIKLEAAKQAQTIAEAAAAAAAATVAKLACDTKEVEKQARLQTLTAIKEVKKTEQQRSKKIQQQLTQQRNHATHLNSLKDKAEMALREANAIRAKAENDVSEIRTQAVIEAQATAAAERQALLDAHEEVAELRNEAASIKANIDAQAQSALSEAVVCAEEVKRQASAEAAAQAEAMIEAAKSRAEQEALSIKAAALEHALALRAKVEEQVQATLDAAKQSKCEADAAAAAAAKLAAAEKDQAEKRARAQAASALKRAKEVDLQRAKKHQRQAMQERRIQELKQRALDEARSQAIEESRKIKEEALQDVTLMKTHARAEAQKLKSKTKAAVRARVQERTQKVTSLQAEALILKAQAEEEVKAIRTQITVEQDALAQQLAELAQKCVPGTSDSMACDTEKRRRDADEEDANETDADEADVDEASEDWEFLPDRSIAHCQDVAGVLVLA